MDKQRKNVRIRVAGIFVEGEKILLVKHSKFGQEYYLLPGGGQETGESLTQTLEREWQEELDVGVVPGKFLFMGESIPPDLEERRQVLQIVFSIESISGTVRLKPDQVLSGCEWVPVQELANIKLFPRCVPQITAFLRGELKEAQVYEKYIWADA